MKYYPNRPCADCGEMLINPHPPRKICAGCARRRNNIRVRENYRARVAVSPKPEPTPEPTLNCLQCRHAALLPETDFTKRGTSIMCNSKPIDVVVGPRAVNLGGCPSAEPMPAKLGRKAWGKVADKFIEQLFSIATHDKRPQMALLLDRNINAVIKRAWKVGIKHPLTAAQRSHFCRVGHKSKPRGLSASQADYVSSIAYSEAWPKRGAARKCTFHQEQTIKREAILRRVAEIGEPRSWDTILNYVQKRALAGDIQ